MNWRYSLILLLCSLLGSGCSYHFQGTTNPLKDFGIQKIYVQSFHNDTFRPGIEQMFTTAMVREIEKNHTFELVNSRKQADAILSGNLSAADSTVLTTTPVQVDTVKTAYVATQYTATITCSVRLEEPNGKVIFSQALSGAKDYTGSALLGDAGATVPLTNDSEQRLAYQFLSTQMMESIYQRMIDLF